MKDATTSGSLSNGNQQEAHTQMYQCGTEPRQFIVRAVMRVEIEHVPYRKYSGPLFSGEANGLPPEI